MRYNLSRIMMGAWRIFRKGGITFSEALHRAWLSAKAEPVNARIVEEVATWSGWRSRGYEVIHGMKALFQAVLIYGSKGDGATYKASFFGASQVKEV